jgi:hypothetical protein
MADLGLLIVARREVNEIARRSLNSLELQKLLPSFR